MSEAESTSRPDDVEPASPGEEQEATAAVGAAEEAAPPADGGAETVTAEGPAGEAASDDGVAADGEAGGADPSAADEGAEAAAGPAKKPVPKAPAAPPKKVAPKAPSKPQAARDLPSPEEIAAWVEGRELPLLHALFDPLPVAKLDILMMQIKKEELLPQHWQVISARPELDGEAFARLPEAGRLRLHYRDQELSRRRLSALEAAWREIAGKQPSLWSVSDLYAAIRRLLEKNVPIDYHDLLCAIRDVWAGMTQPYGREQLEVLWAVLDFQRSKTK